MSSNPSEDIERAKEVLKQEVAEINKQMEAIGARNYPLVQIRDQIQSLIDANVSEKEVLRKEIDKRLNKWAKLDAF